MARKHTQTAPVIPAIRTVSPLAWYLPLSAAASQPAGWARQRAGCQTGGSM